MAIQIRTSLDEPETGQSFIPHRPARPPKAEGGRPFKIVSEYTPAGDQPTAIAELVRVLLPVAFAAISPPAALIRDVV